MGKASKDNPFMLYMRFRRKELEQQGRRFPGGWQELANLLNDDWMKMKPEEKERWKCMGKGCKGMVSSDPDTFGYDTTKSASSSLRQRQHTPYRDKFVLQDYKETEVLMSIKSRFLKLVQDEAKLLTTGFCVVNFSYYDKGDHPFTLEPAEYAIAKWSIMDGIRVFETSLIDTLRRYKNEKDTRGTRRNEILCVPPPDYTYEKGLGYSAGEDDYGKILKSICDNAIGITDIEGVKWKYVFTSRQLFETVQECLAWFMFKCEVDVKIRVFPLEPVLQELFRCAATIKTLKQRGYGHLCQDPDAPLLDVNLLPEDYEFIMGKATEDYVTSAVVGPRHYTMKNWDINIHFACAWHQQRDNYGGYFDCPSKHTRKWTCLALAEVTNLLGRQPGPWIQFLQDEDQTPTSWTIRDAMDIEIRQRVGLEPVTDKRRAVLEDKFVFPSLLSLLRQKYPMGLPQVPSVIIWPVDRDMEVDLNYCDKAAFVVCDPHRDITLKKREEKAQRDAEKKQRFREMEVGWGKDEEFDIT